MKPGMSSLNPYAAPFIPLSRRTDNGNIASTTPEICNVDEATAHYTQVTESETRGTKINCGDSKIGDENPQQQFPNISILNINSSSIEGPPLWKDCNTHNYEDSMPYETNNRNESQSMIEDYELDLAYLAAAFPSISEQSLVDVYCANAGDLEASVDMLIQLEVLSYAPTVLCFLLFLHLFI